MNIPNLAKAVIINLDKPGFTVECMFNPKEYSFSKSNSWQPAETPGVNMPQLEFGSGQPATLSMQLFFDTYAKGVDVRKSHTDRIWQLMLIDEQLQSRRNNRGRPPRVRFQWGLSWSFEAVITSITQRFTLFLADGTPVRATLDVAFQQIKDEQLFPRQNPTSGGIGGERMRTVQAGDTLAWIAYKEYGDPNRWRVIADANRLTQVRYLTPGTELVIPYG
jgi:nucleoid-associated protein YgaU